MGNTGDTIKYQSDSGRRYKVPLMKVSYPGVTSIISNAWPSPYLEDWRIGNIANRCIEDAPRLAKRLKKISKRPDSMREFSKQSLRKTFIEWKEDYTAANRGTRIHSLVEAHLTNTKAPDVPITSDEADTAIMAIAALDDLGFTAEYVECIVFNHWHQYAGTVDIIGTYKKRVGKKTKTIRAVVDLKTGRRVNKSYIPQIAAYARAEEIYISEDKGELMPKVHQGLILHARPKKAEFYRVDLATGWDTFLACRTIHTAANTSKGMVKL